MEVKLKEKCIDNEFKYDEACIIMKNEADVSNLWLYTLSSDCIDCPYVKQLELIKSKILNLQVNTAKSQFWRLIETTGTEKYVLPENRTGLYCELTPEIGEYGIYELTADRDNKCSFDTKKESYNTYVPLGIAVGAIVLLLSSLSMLKFIKRCINNHCSRKERKEVTENPKAKRRVRSIDAVRGMSILMMIFVNTGAGAYTYLEHATWDGLYVGDLVFPCFMWIMGVCIPLSISSQLSRGTSRLSVCRAIVKRSVYLFFIGLCLNTLGGWNQLENIRIFGVLQRFGISYLVTGVVYALAFRLNASSLKDSVSKSLRDILNLLPQWIVAFLILALHCAIIYFLPVPGCPKGYLGPGGRHAAGKYLNCSGGATGYVDKVLLGENHIYQSPTANTVYESGPFDPEGILGCLTSIFQVFLGIQTGQILREYKEWKSRLLRWVSWALILAVIGLALHFSNSIPINKNLWSISFVMVTTSFSLGLLSISYFIIDVVRIWEGGPFRIPGMNALVMYVGHQVFHDMFPFHWKIGEMKSHSWLLAESLWCVGLWTCIGYILNRKRIYVKL